MALEETYRNDRFQHWGTTQQSRLLTALLPESTPVEEKTPAEHLFFAHQLARHLTFYNSQDEPAGDWQRFFDKDISVFLSSIAILDTRDLLKKRDLQLDRITHATHESDRVESLRAFFDFAWQIIKDFDAWHRRLNHFFILSEEKGKGFLREVNTLIQGRLTANLHKLQKLSMQARKIDKEAAPYPLYKDRLSDIWEQAKQELFISDAWERELETDFIDLAQVEQVSIILKHLQLEFQSLLNAYLQVIRSASSYLKVTLEQKQNHPPDIGLYLAFVHLLDYLKKDVNALTEAHLVYYYQQLLGQKPRPAEADEVNVQVIISEEADKGYYMPKGTLLRAGSRNEVETFYEVQKSTYLNRARLAALKTIFVAKNPDLESTGTYRIASNVYTSAVANSRDGEGAPLGPLDSWPTFGEDQLLKANSERNMQVGAVGFAISDPIFLLSEGERTVHLRLSFDQSTFVVFDKLIADLGKEDKLSRDRAFSLYLSDVFQLFFSTEKGWYPLKYFSMKPTLGPLNYEIELNINLGRMDPAIVPWPEGLEGDDLGSPWPILKVMLNPDVIPYGYSFLKDLILENIFLEVEVKKLRQLDVFNDAGKQDISQPFPLFGPIPTRGSYVLIGNAELFKKRLSKLQLQLDWHNLPNKEGGLTEYYAPYELGLTSGSFLVDTSVLKEGAFSPAGSSERPIYTLFQSANPETPFPPPPPPKKLALGIEKPVKSPPPPPPDDDPAHAIAESTRLDEINLQVLGFQPDYQLQDTSTYDLKSRSGFFRLSLIAPKVAFAHQEFPNIFTEVVTNNSVNRGLRQLNPFKRYKIKPVPEPPYTPSVQQISIDYTAQARINLQQTSEVGLEEGGGAFYHIHPFGVREAYLPREVKSRNLLPQFDYEGYLYLGLEQIEPGQELSLFFQMEKNPNHQFVEVLPEIDWSYHTGEGWLPLQKNNFISDATRGFTSSGIICLEVPTNIAPQAVYAGEPPMAWLRIAVRGNIQILSRTYFLCAQAVHARWVPNENPDHLRSPLPAESITRLDTSVSEVVELIQPYPSFGGKAEENRNDFFTRTSERLRHKNRVVTSWDIEHLVLERFPEIHQVKSLSHVAFPQHVPKGSTLVVVVPDPNGWEAGTEPKVGYGLLQQIKEYLEGLASSFIRFYVRNPQYDRLRLRCEVVFKDKRNASGLVRQLAQDLEKHICPWRQDKRQPLKLGGGLGKEAILQFINSLDYVHFVTAFSLIQVIEHEAEERLEERTYSLYDANQDHSHDPMMVASKPWSVIIPSETHLVTYRLREEQNLAEPAGIGNLAIGNDFIITREEPPAPAKVKARGLMKAEEGTEEEEMIYLTIDLE
jgi:hypothetical protein